MTSRVTFGRSVLWQPGLLTLDTRQVRFPCKLPFPLNGGNIKVTGI